MDGYLWLLNSYWLFISALSRSVSYSVIVLVTRYSVIWLFGYSGLGGLLLVILLFVYWVRFLGKGANSYWLFGCLVIGVNPSLNGNLACHNIDKQHKSEHFCWKRDTTIKRRQNNVYWVQFESFNCLEFFLHLTQVQ